MSAYFSIKELKLRFFFIGEGWYEQDPVEIIDVVKECIEMAVKKLVELGGNPMDIKAIGITNQRETTVVWDPETGLCLR